MRRQRMLMKTRIGWMWKLDHHSRHPRESNQRYVTRIRYFTEYIILYLFYLFFFFKQQAVHRAEIPVIQPLQPPKPELCQVRDLRFLYPWCLFLPFWFTSFVERATGFADVAGIRTRIQSPSQVQHIEGAITFAWQQKSTHLLTTQHFCLGRA